MGKVEKCKWAKNCRIVVWDGIITLIYVKYLLKF